MVTEYNRSRMIGELEKYFERRGYKTTRYLERQHLDEIRLPLYCTKEAGKILDEIIVDIITESHVSKESYLPDISKYKTLVLNACSVKFFQYYMPHAKVFWAFGHYVQRDKDYKYFKETCKENGIGLLSVHENGVKQILPPLSLIDIWQNSVKDEISRWAQLQPLADQLGDGVLDQLQPLADQLSDGVLDINKRYLEEYGHRIIIYGHPKFRQRAIIAREAEDISPLLINELQGLSNIAYAERLKELAVDFRREEGSDYDIAFNTIRDLWLSRFQIEYPNLQKDFEKVLRLDPKYRDHFLHQFQVFLLGVLIIDTLYSESWVQDFEDGPHPSKFEDAWLAASTYHDFNYPIQQWEQWTTNFLKQTFHTKKSTIGRHLEHPEIKNQIVQLHLGKVVIRDEFISKMSALSKSLGCEFDDCFQRFILRRVAIDKDHAVLGAFTLLEKFQGNDMLNESARTEAAASILLHDQANWQCFCGNESATKSCSINKKLSLEEKDICIKESIKELSLQSKPLAFLLIFCDTAQEWGRYGGEDAENETPLLESIYITPHEVRVHVSITDKKDRKRKREEIEEVGQYLKDSRFTIQISRRKQDGELVEPNPILMLGKAE